MKEGQIKAEDVVAERQLDQIRKAYFFCSNRDEYSTAEDLLKSIIFQLIQQGNSLAVYAKQFTREKKKTHLRKPPAQATVENLWGELFEPTARVYLLLNNLHALPRPSESTDKPLSYINQALDPDVDDDHKWPHSPGNDIDNILDVKGRPLINLTGSEIRGSDHCFVPDFVPVEQSGCTLVCFASAVVEEHLMKRQLLNLTEEKKKKYRHGIIAYRCFDDLYDRFGQGQDDNSLGYSTRSTFKGMHLNSMTSLHKACSGALVEALIQQDYGDQINVHDGLDNTPVSRLLSFSSNTEPTFCTINGEGKNALQIALENGSESPLKILIDRVLSSLTGNTQARGAVHTAKSPVQLSPRIRFRRLDLLYLLLRRNGRLRLQQPLVAIQPTRSQPPLLRQVPLPNGGLEVAQLPLGRGLELADMLEQRLARFQDLLRGGDVSGAGDDEAWCRRLLLLLLFVCGCGDA
ncbi:hypothetical protein L249_5718 [Ophiocordyceps polyrhachis-furcata BCC 54312]|uniref:Uncharacterized protein n=1 Tax=Ophiocordyceps polyrhachis-furcata BCC 54312 TaxID=1330021 RepID=A0A367KZW4_9HYPO|nr:hypothetical protein L249_5718 [Ophiocordyceps polyrhachis-furcata BCC 54312]